MTDFAIGWLWLEQGDEERGGVSFGAMLMVPGGSAEPGPLGHIGCGHGEQELLPLSWVCSSFWAGSIPGLD